MMLDTSLLICDVTEEKAEMTVEMNSRFLANLLHEIRTPMTAILGFSETLADKEISRKKIGEIARIIRDNSEYLLHLLNDVLDYSKMEAEMLKIETSSFSLENLLSEIHSIFTLTAREKKLDFVIRNTTPFPEKIHSDPFRLKQILLNLVGNAFKFTEKGKVEILVSWLGNSNQGLGQLKLDVNDTGKGISKNALERIFYPFEQENNSLPGCHAGTGLGLAISRHLVRLLCGNLTVASTPELGSCFSVFLPQQVLPSTVWKDHFRLDTVKKTQPEHVPSGNIEVQSLKERRILLIDDSVDIQGLFLIILEKAGADVTLANNGREGVNAVEKSLLDGKPFDVILMDMQMPVMDGFITTKILRDKGIEIPIVALTAHVMQEERDRCHAAGCSGYLTKPILRDVLLTAVAKIIETKVH